MKKAIQMMILATALISVSGHSASVMGAGTKSCGAWTNDMKEEGVDKYLQAQWLLGYVSGVASMVTEADIIKERDAHGLARWMDIYCKDNPLALIQNGADALAVMLIKNSK